MILKHLSLLEEMDGEYKGQKIEASRAIRGDLNQCDQKAKNNFTEKDFFLLSFSSLSFSGKF